MIGGVHEAGLRKQASPLEAPSSVMALDVVRKVYTHSTGKA